MIRPTAFLLASAALMGQTLGMAPNSIRTVLTANVGLSDTTVTIAVCDKTTAGMTLNIDSELMTGTSVNYATCVITVIRAILESSASRHHTGAIVSAYVSSAPATDVGYSSFVSAYAAASGAGKTLNVASSWAAVPSGTYANLSFSTGGILHIASGATITIAENFLCPPTQQCFDTSASGAAVAFTTLPSPAYVPWFGGNHLGAAGSDNTPAFNAAYASSPGNVRFPAGTYNFASQLLIPNSYSGVSCESRGNTKLIYTGGPVADFVMLGGSSYLAREIKFENCYISGSANVTNAVHVNHVVQSSRIQDLEIHNSTAVCFWVDAVVSVNFPNIQCSANGDTTSSTDGVYVSGSTSSVFTVGVFEYHSGIGRHISGSLNITFIGGTSESNGVNTRLESGAAYNALINVDDEQQCTQNYYDAGRQNSIYGGLITGGLGQPASAKCPAPASNESVRIASTAIQPRIDNLSADGFRIDAGASGASITNSLTGNNGAFPTITDNGLGSNLQNNWVCCSGTSLTAQRLPDKIGNNQVLLGGPGNTSLLASNSRVAIGRAAPPSAADTTDKISIGTSSTASGFDTNGPIISLQTRTTGGLVSTSSFNMVQGTGANNALTATLVDGDGVSVPPRRGMCLMVSLQFTLRAGANTLSLNGGAALPISSHVTAGNLTIPYSVTSALINLCYSDGFAAWLDMSQ
jgi:hypothetical protein